MYLRTRYSTRYHLSKIRVRAHIFYISPPFFVPSRCEGGMGHGALRATAVVL